MLFKKYKKNCVRDLKYTDFSLLVLQKIVKKYA